jgi:hypothetical protein
VFGELMQVAQGKVHAMQLAGCIEFPAVREAAWLSKYPLLQLKQRLRLRQVWHPLAHEAQVLLLVKY